VAQIVTAAHRDL